MKLLLDTCAILWLVDDREKLSDAAIRAISAEDATLFVSTISAFEIAVKVRKAKLTLPRPAMDWFRAAVCAHGIIEILISSSIAVHSCDVPLSHNDPADRMIVATALLERLSIITSDHVIRACPGLSVVW